MSQSPEEQDVSMAALKEIKETMGSNRKGVFNLLGEDMVAIGVGTGANSKRFLVHKNLLCKKVNYFDKMFNGAFKEGIEQKAAFPEDDLDAWSLLVDWIYGGKAALEFTVKPSADAWWDELPGYFKAVGLAEKYLIHDFANILMNRIVGMTNSLNIKPNTESMATGYSHTAKGSMLRLYLARFLAFMSFDTTYSKDWDELSELGENHPEILQDMLKVINHRATESGTVNIMNPNKASYCDYHRHGPDSPCSKASTAKSFTTSTKSAAA